VIKYVEAFQRAIAVLDNLDVDHNDRDIVKTQALTEKIIARLQKGAGNDM